eukprot:scaffold30104_cov140-Isochrysis_galbana.AAC.3
MRCSGRRALALPHVRQHVDREQRTPRSRCASLPWHLLRGAGHAEQHAVHHKSRTAAPTARRRVDEGRAWPPPSRVPAPRMFCFCLCFCLCRPAHPARSTPQPIAQYRIAQQPHSTSTHAALLGPAQAEHAGAHLHSKGNEPWNFLNQAHTHDGATGYKLQEKTHFDYIIVTLFKDT